MSDQPKGLEPKSERANNHEEPFLPTIFISPVDTLKIMRFIKKIKQKDKWPHQQEIGFGN